MVKGVHKKIIEVKSPDGDYFEKAVFYLKPGVSELPDSITAAAAQMIMQEYSPQPHRPLWKRFLLITGIIILTAIIAVCAAVIA